MHDMDNHDLTVGPWPGDDLMKAVFAEHRLVTEFDPAESAAAGEDVYAAACTCGRMPPIQRQPIEDIEEAHTRHVETEVQPRTDHDRRQLAILSEFLHCTYTLAKFLGLNPGDVCELAAELQRGEWPDARIAELLTLATGQMVKAVDVRT